MKDRIIRLDRIPEALLEISATELHQLFDRPALVHLDGHQAEPLFVSVLLHGNETTGLAAIQSLLKKRAGKPWPRSVSFFIGNVQAARKGLRRLEDQPDYNRIWPGTEQADCQETRLARAVYDEMASRGVFASIDVHNNTGRNPHYACVERLDEPTLKLAVLFDRLVVYSPYPKGTQTGAFARLCPSVTLECGQPGECSGVERASEFIESCLRLPEIPHHPLQPQELDLFHALAQVTVRCDVRFSYSDANADLLLNGHLDQLNFTELLPGTVLGRVAALQPGAQLPLIARTDDGRDIAPEFFRIDSSNRLVLKKTAMPCMLSLEENIIRQDCLCYLMERIHAHGH